MNLLSHGRFFEYEVSWVEVPYLEFDSASNTSYGINVTELVVLPTELRQNVGYIQVERKAFAFNVHGLTTGHLMHPCAAPKIACSSEGSRVLWLGRWS